MTRQVASTTALVLGFLVILLLGGRMIRYFGLAAEGRLDVGLLFTIIGYNLPYFLELVLPLSFFIGLMLVFGRLYVDHEMAVLNSSGISRGRLARLMTPLIVLLFIVEAGLSLYGKPWGVKSADEIWQQQSISSAFDLIRPQSFISSDDYHLYVGSMNEDRTELQDVILIQTAKDKQAVDGASMPDDLQPPETQAAAEAPAANTDGNVDNNTDAVDSDSEQLSLKEDKAVTALTDPVVTAQTGSSENRSGSRDVIVLAKRAVQVGDRINSDSTQLDLYQGRRYEVGADSLVYNQISFERYRITINQPPNDVITEDNVATLPLPILWEAATGQAMPLSDIEQGTPAFDEMVSQNKQQVLAAKAELGYRLSLPWLIIIAPMLAVPLAQVRPRQGRWLRLLPAIMIYTSCALVIISLKNAVTKGNISVASYPLVIIGFMILALYLNWASRIHHRVRFRLGQGATQTTTSHDNTTNKGGRS
ncbi:LPS export ABC transporter permease LptF [Psychrobacter sp. FDAARGOS_221]|uniref:LPS export ABC transporter permease LptF n=1 Tax=Psychrobacter sp. FDAARGOS_221 TaxID=1975705 RepID=UPI000BB55432|nr:LPS export ABC transporter permease LptF [Psychrobacter sp. FDAARGOS_221]PNK60836.1 LptF/LptG family permease [Psychrobacter sp. FDAARGOS_221]